MKIRNGFVSNSSSSSFVVKVSENFPDLFSLAKCMIERKIEEYENDWNKPSYKKDIINLQKSKIDRNTPIMFGSCNYDTYIIKDGEYYIVNTCNNIDWDLDDYIIYNIPKVLEDKYDINGYCSNIQKDSKFYIADVDRIGTITGETCSKCYFEIWEINGKKYCNCEGKKLKDYNK